MLRRMTKGKASRDIIPLGGTSQDLACLDVVVSMNLWLVKLRCSKVWKYVKATSVEEKGLQTANQEDDLHLCTHPKWGRVRSA